MDEIDKTMSFVVGVNVNDNDSFDCGATAAICGSSVSVTLQHDKLGDRTLHIPWSVIVRWISALAEHSESES